MRIEDLNKISTKPLEEVPDIENWEAPSEFPPIPQPGNFVLSIGELRDFTENADKTVGTAVLDFVTLEGERISFQRLSNRVFERRDGTKSSQLLDLGMSSNSLTTYPQNNQEWAKLLLNLKNRQAKFGGTVNWRGFCNTCYQSKLVAITQTSSYDEAKVRASSEEKRLASGFATKAKDARGFPENGGGHRKENFTCNDCNSEIRAQGRITRFYPLQT